MITSVKIKNFQNHKKTKIVFKDGLNTITGQTDSGKSAIFRAINWLIHNKPSGDSFRSHWGGKTSVTLTTHKDTIKRVKDKKTNAYFLNNQKFFAFKHTVPAEVQKAIRISDLNLQRQMSSPFLFSLPGGKVSQYINNIINVNIIDESVTNINRIIRKEKSDYEFEKDLYLQRKSEIKRFAWLPEAEKQLVLLEAQHRSIASKERNVQAACNLLELIRKTNKQLRKINRLSAIDKDIHFKRAIKLAERIRTKQRVLIEANKILMSVSVLKRNIQQINVKLEKNERTLKNLLKVCPLCGRKG